MAIFSTLSAISGASIILKLFAEWKYDEDNCWNECVCGDKTNVTKHADENNDGKCDACAYPVSKPSDSPQTSDNSNMVLWFSLLMLSALGVIATIIIGKKRYSVK